MNPLTSHNSKWSNDVKGIGSEAGSSEISLSLSGPVILNGWEDIQVFLHNSSVNLQGKTVECNVIENQLHIEPCTRTTGNQSHLNAY